MSVAEIKAEARKLSFQPQQSELSRYMRSLALRNNPVWRKQVSSALKSSKWISQAEMEQAIAKLERAGK